jgi:cell wall-associated NlpC family hydrolase
MPARGISYVVHCAVVALGVALAPVAHAGGSLTASAAETAGKVWAGAQDVAMFALGLTGVTYRFGGNTPDGGLDCSGLVRYVFQEVTGVSLPRTSKEMSTLGARVAAAELQPGDLVFFNTRRFAFSHVGIYLGDNRFIHAPSRGSEVEIANLSKAYWQKSYNGARRLVGVVPELMPNIVSPAIAAGFEPLPVAASTSRIIDVADATP